MSLILKLAHVYLVICRKHLNEWSLYHNLINSEISLEHPIFNKLLCINITI